MIYAGIDAGSRAIKIVLLDGDTREVLASGTADQGTDQDTRASRLLEVILSEKQLRRNALRRIVATGYARDTLSFADTTITEITCHARGVYHLLPEARTIIEIGGQDSKILHLAPDGSVRDFEMNDRCAAGTGRFLEIVADRLKVDLQEFGEIAARSAQPATVSNTCAVFAETEIIGLLAAGAGKEDIMAGVEASIAARVAGMIRGTAAPVVAFTGGVARIRGMDKSLAKAVKQEIVIPPAPQVTGALGAALLAMDAGAKPRA